MEKKCPHHPDAVLCRHRRKDAEGSRVGRGVGSHHHHHHRHAGSKVGQIKVVVIPTTGGQLELCVSPADTVRGLKQVLARKYRIAPSRINLLHQERVLKDGTLQDNQVTEGSRLVLCPNMESGTSSSRAEHSVVQALKNLSQAQIHDFLSGRAPLTLAIRLGEHLMFVQLQLSSTTSPSAPRSLSVQPTPPSTPTVPPSTPPPTPPSTPASSTTTTPAAAAAGQGSSSGPRRADGGGGGGSGGDGHRPLVDPVSLLQASHNLTEKLKELTHLTQQALQAGAHRSQAVPSSIPLTPPPSPPPSPGAVIDSMQHVGRGVYSGTFSGTLHPRLQDRSGQPRRDVHTILHILHDLLLARPSQHLAPSASPHPQAAAPPLSPRSPTLGEDEAALRTKVHRVQMMLEQRRQRRLARRLAHRPYPSSSSSSSRPHSLSQPTTAFPFPPPSEPHASSSAPSSTSAAGESNVDTANYRKPNMEQETVAV